MLTENRLMPCHSTRLERQQFIGKCRSISEHSVTEMLSYEMLQCKAQGMPYGVLSAVEPLQSTVLLSYFRSAHWRPRPPVVAPEESHTRGGTAAPAAAHGKPLKAKRQKKINVHSREGEGRVAQEPFPPIKAPAIYFSGRLQWNHFARTDTV